MSGAGESRGVTPPFAVGQVGTATTEVSAAHTAQAVGSGSLPVFATPMLVALMEQAACHCLAPHLPEGQTSVGTHVDIHHTAASPQGAHITATATITQVNGRQIVFEVRATDGTQEVGHGTHTRVAVDAARFMGRL